MEPITSDEIDSANGVLHLHYDPDNSVMFVIGKVTCFVCKSSFFQLVYLEIN